jgi:four helix bundle protein
MMKLEELQVYQLSMKLGEDVWQFVNKWEYFHKDTIGKQFVRAVDSIAANISEGFGRYHYNEGKHFGYYARGSLYESKTWLVKAFNRKLICESDYSSIIQDIDTIGIKLNKYINSIGNNH